MNSHSRAIEHVKNYRFGGSSLHSSGTFCEPYLKSAVELGGPQLKTFAQAADVLFDNVLTSADAYLPHHLKRDETQAIVEAQVLAKFPVQHVEKGKEVLAANDSVYETYVHMPLHRLAMDARSRYAFVYDTQGKALLRSSVDRAVMPLNKALEGYAMSHFKGVARVPKTGFSNEMSRTVRLVGATARSLVPRTVSHTANHVYDTFAENYVSQNGSAALAPITATVATTRAISNDVVQYVRSAIVQ